MSEPEDVLSDDDLAVLARMRETVAKAKEQPGFGSRPLANPDKFMGPVGANEKGEIKHVRKPPPESDDTAAESDEE